MIACSQTPIEKEVYNNTLLCPSLLVAKQEDNLEIKTHNLQKTRFIAQIHTSKVVCSIEDNIMNLAFNIDIEASKKDFLKDSYNPIIPLGYYIELDLIGKQTNTTNEISRGLYFITLEEKNNKIFATQRRIINLPQSEYDFSKSKIRIGFLSEDKTMVTY